MKIKLASLLTKNIKIALFILLQPLSFIQTSPAQTAIPQSSCELGDAENCNVLLDFIQNACQDTMFENGIWGLVDFPDTINDMVAYMKEKESPSKRDTVEILSAIKRHSRSWILFTRNGYLAVAVRQENSYRTYNAKAYENRQIADPTNQDKCVFINLRLKND